MVHLVMIGDQYGGVSVFVFSTLKQAEKELKEFRKDWRTNCWIESKEIITDVKSE